MIQGGSLGRVTQVENVLVAELPIILAPKPVDTQALDWKQWLGRGGGAGVQRRKVLPVEMVSGILAAGR